MRRVALADLQPGMVVARDVADGKGGLLLRRGVPLTAAYVRALAERGYGWVYISDEAADLLVVEDVVASYVASSYPSLLQTMHATFADGQAGLDLPAEHEQEAGEVATVISQTLSPSVVTGLARMMAADQTLVYHGLNTAAVAVAFAIRMGFDESSVRSLAVGCLLHDCGKTALSEAVLLLPLLSDEQLDELRRHPALGLQVAREVGLSDQHALTVIAQHHERQDGAGYPRGLRGNNRISSMQQSGRIGLVAEIAAVADSFSILTSGSLREGSLTPPQVRFAMRRLAGPVLNRQLVSSFLDGRRRLPIGAAAYVRAGRLAGYRGVIVRRSPVNPETAVVRLTQGPAGIWMQPFEVDLGEEPDAGVGVVLS